MHLIQYLLKKKKGTSRLSGIQECGSWVILSQDLYKAAIKVLARMQSS